MIAHTLRYTIPAAYALLPPRMASPAATALLLAIGLQESRFLARRQGMLGPARGFWQFERGGVDGVLRHPASAPYAASVLRDLVYPGSLDQVAYVHSVLEHNDTLACVFARLLLWTVPGALPTREQPMAAWNYYLAGWRPGKPHLETWVPHLFDAWDRVDGPAPPAPLTA